MDTVVLQITNKCPFNCPQCYMQKGNQNMDFSVAVEAIKKAKSLGGKAVQLTGGEPMCYPYINELVAVCKEQGLYSMMATSGYANSIYAYKRLAESGLTAICVSLNSSKKSVNQQTREGYDCATNAIEIAVEVGLLCFVNVVLTEETVATLEQTVYEMKSKGVVGVELLKRLPNYKGENPKQLTKEELSIINKVVKDNGDFVRVENCCFEYWKEYCGDKKITCEDAGSKSFFWNVDGYVSPCSKNTQYKFATIEELLENKDKWGKLCF